MKRTACVASVLAVLIMAARADDSAPSIKEIMGKLHKGANAPLARLKTALKADTPDWKDIRDKTKDFVIFGAALAKNTPPRGDKASFENLADTYYQNTKALDHAAKSEDMAKARAALTKIAASCMACHSAHKKP
jgi:hypothetical protein